jgi:deferrochelatase/peroxidase EfeB
MISATVAYYITLSDSETTPQSQFMPSQFPLQERLNGFCGKSQFAYFFPTQLPKIKQPQQNCCGCPFL